MHYELGIHTRDFVILVYTCFHNLDLREEDMSLMESCCIFCARITYEVLEGCKLSEEEKDS